MVYILFLRLFSKSAPFFFQKRKVQVAPKKKGDEKMITEFNVSGIHCPSCTEIIKMNLEEIKGVSVISADKGKGIIKVKHDEKVQIAELAKAIEKEGGYKVKGHKESKA